MDKKWNVGIMEFWNIGFNTEKKFLPIIPLFQFSSVSKYCFHYSNIPLVKIAGWNSEGRQGQKE